LFYYETLNEREHLRDKSVNGRMMFKRDFGYIAREATD